MASYPNPTVGNEYTYPLDSNAPLHSPHSLPTEPSLYFPLSLKCPSLHAAFWFFLLSTCPAQKRKAATTKQHTTVTEDEEIIRRNNESSLPVGLGSLFASGGYSLPPCMGGWPHWSEAFPRTLAGGWV